MDAPFTSSKGLALTWLATYLLFLALFLPSALMSQNREQDVSESGKPTGYISIGLLLPDLSHKDLIASAELAIEHANSEAVGKNQRFKIIVRSTEGFWGAGSKESVSLVYEDQVCAIIGSLDGRNGHLAEQVAAKSQLSYIETYATDPSLSQAFVPWFMRVVPNDNQQAFTLADQIEREGGGSIGILSTDDYDTRYAVKSLSKVLSGKTGKTPLLIELDIAGIQQREVIETIRSAKLDHLLIPFDAEYLEDLIKGLKEVSPDLMIYGTLHHTMGVESRNSSWDSYEGMYMLGTQFNRASHPALPNIRSACVYDAVSMVINAIVQVGTSREAITEYLSESTYSGGITGRISFDEMGNRLNATTLNQIRDGAPHLIINH